MTKNTAAQQIRLKVVDLIAGTSDPSTGGGVTAAVASFYLRQNGTAGTAFLKTGAADTAWTQMTQSFAWYSVKDYGATGDGVTDDRSAIQSAITACAAAGGGVVYFPAGTYIVGQNGALGYSFQLSAATDIQFLGAGPNSILKMSGNAGAAAWSMFQLTGACARIRWEELCFDGSGVTNPGANNNHLLQIGTGAAGAMATIQVFQCTFQGMVAGSGDAVRFQGSAGNLISRFWVADCVFNLGSGQYGVHVLQGTQYGWVVGSAFTACTRDIVVDTSADVNINGLVIYGNQIAHSGTDKLAVQIVGGATGLVTRLTMGQNVIVGGFMEVSNIQYATFTGNVQTSGDFASGNSACRLYGTVEDTTFSSNVVERGSGSSAGPCLSLEASGGASPTRVRLGSNVLLQDVASAGFVSVVDATLFSVGQNVCFSSANVGASSQYAIDVQAVTADVNDVVIGGNTVVASAGSFAAAVRMLVNGANIVNFSIVGNQLSQVDYIAELNDAGAGSFTGIPMIAENNGDTATGDINLVGTTVTPRVGWNAGTFGTQLFQGNGSPEGAVSAYPGSMYLNTAGGAGTSVYYKETGSGTNTGWIGIGGTMVVFGAGSIGTGASTVYLGSGFETTLGTTELQIPVTRPGTIRNLRVRTMVAGTGHQLVTYTVRKNGVDTSLVATVQNDAAAPNTASDLTAAHGFTVIAGDTVSISVAIAAVVAAGAQNVVATVELA